MSKHPLILGALLVLSVVGLIYNNRHVDIISDRYSPRLVGAGDSIMSGGNTLILLSRQLKRHTGDEWRTLNFGIGGGHVGREITSARIPESPPYRLPWSKKDVVWVIAGTNNIGYVNGPEVVEDLLSKTELMFRELHAKGYTKDQCYLTDILPRDASLAFEADRVSFNSRIGQRLIGLAHVVPSGSNPKLQNPKDTAVFKDGVHPAHYGDEILAADALDVILTKLK